MGRPPDGGRPTTGNRGYARGLMRRPFIAILCAGALLGAAACGGDEKAAPGNQVDGILAASADIVFQCRAVESGLLSRPNAEVLEQDVDALLLAVRGDPLDRLAEVVGPVDAAESVAEVDPDEVESGDGGSKEPFDQRVPAVCGCHSFHAAILSPGWKLGKGLRRTRSCP